MKKPYHKKELSVEESPLTLQLQRRHTVVEGDKKKVSVATKAKPVCRSNSTSSIYRPPKSAKDLISQKRYLESTLSANSSGRSTASTVVITDSQLSSSWIYNNKKAQMCSKEPSSPAKISSQQISDNEENKLPTIHKSKIKSVSSPNHRSKRCTRCCYATIIILAIVALAGILTAIGGFVYIEFFSGKNKTQTVVSGSAAIGRRGDSSYTKKVGQSTDVRYDHTSPDLTFREESSAASLPELKQDLKVHGSFKNLPSDSIENKYGKKSGNILRVKKAKDTTTTEADVSISVQKNEPQPKEDSSGKQNLNNTNVPPSIAKNNSPYSKLFELYRGIHSILTEDINSSERPSTFDADKLNSKITDPEETSDIFENKALELLHESNTEKDKDLRILDESFDSNDTSKDSLNQKSDLNLEQSHTPNEGTSEPAIPKYFFRRPNPNMLDINEGNDVGNSNVLPPVKILTQMPQILDEEDSSNDKVINKQSINNHDALFDSKESINTALDSDLISSHIPNGEVSGPAIPKNFFQLPTKDTSSGLRNMLEIKADQSEEPPLSRFLPHIPELSDSSDGDDKENIDSDVNKELPLELNRPVNGAKIAVPGPLDLLRRFAMGTEADSKDNSEMEKHDRRYFLAQAMERLRTLDVRNILPSSRQKKDSKSPKPKLEPKVQSEKEVVTERSSYLQKLRRHFFEQ